MVNYFTDWRKKPCLASKTWCDPINIKYDWSLTQPTRNLLVEQLHRRTCSYVQKKGLHCTTLQHSEKHHGRSLTYYGVSIKPILTESWKAERQSLKLKGKFLVQWLQPKVAVGDFLQQVKRYFFSFLFFDESFLFKYYQICYPKSPTILCFKREWKEKKSIATELGYGLSGWVFFTPIVFSSHCGIRWESIRFYKILVATIATKWK